MSATPCSSGKEERGVCVCLCVVFYEVCFVFAHAGKEEMKWLE